MSRNIGVIKAFEDAIGEKIHVDPNAHLMGALGAAILSKNRGVDAQRDNVQNINVRNMKADQEFSLDITDFNFVTKGYDCNKCANNCEVIHFFKDEQLIDVWGKRCEN